ncbi:MAG: hypothetical protein HZA60_09520 [Deltaproteobacteria bacterium]|nr:hypothetical protein [Deltaproteobacteria bacterium]
MTIRDTEAVLRVDEWITGAPHEAQWDSRIIEYVSRNPLGCLVAEEDGKCVDSR